MVGSYQICVTRASDLSSSTTHLKLRAFREWQITRTTMALDALLPVNVCMPARLGVLERLGGPSGFTKSLRAQGQARA